MQWSEEYSLQMLSYKPFSSHKQRNQILQMSESKFHIIFVHSSHISQSAILLQATL